jgi:hypothetical protein
LKKNRKDENFEELDALMKAMEDIVSNCEMYNTESQKSSEKVQNFVETSSESDVDLENIEISDENSQGFNPVYQIQKSTNLSQGAVNSTKDLVEKETRKPSKIPILKRAN